MLDQRAALERAERQFSEPNADIESVRRRSSQRRRNQRISAGVVGLGVFVAAVLIVTTFGSLDRTQTPAVPGGAGTTGQSGTGPAGTGPVIGPTGDPYSVGFAGLPPEGATPSEPLLGELVLRDGGIHPYYSVNVYADGRLIWARDAVFTGEFVPTPQWEGVSAWIEQRLTREGIELLRSGAVPLGGQFENPGEELPVSAWEDPELRPYVPSTYAACLWGGFKPPYRTLDILPPWAQDLLRDRPVVESGSTETGPCPVVTIEDARALVEILRDAGFEQSEVGASGWVGAVAVFKGTDFGGANFKGSGIEFVPLLPDGTIQMTGG